MHINIGVPTVAYLPMYNNCSVSGLQRRKNCLYPGFDVEILHQFLKMAGITYDLVTVVPAEIGLLHNNSTWVGGMLGEMSRQHIDTVAYTMIITELRNKYFDFTHPVSSDPYTFVYKTVDESFFTFCTTLMRPFKVVVWTIMLTLFLLLFSIWVIFHRRSVSSHCDWLLESIWDFFCFVQGRENEDASKNNVANSKKIFLTLLTLFAVFFSCLYQGLLVISFFDYKQPVLFSSFGELLKLLGNGDLRIVTENDKWAFFERVYTDTNIVFQQLKGALINNPYVKVNAIEDLFPYLQSGKYVYPTAKSMKLTYTRGQCSLSTIEMGDLKEWSGFAFQKNSSIVSILNKLILNSYPMIEHFTRKYFEQNIDINISYPLCPVSKAKDSLSLLDLSGAFILFLLGTIVGLAIYFCEHWRRKFFKCWKNTYYIVKL